MIFEDGTWHEVVHLMFQRPDGQWRFACVPGMVKFGTSLGQMKPWQGSDDPRAVNCPVCMKKSVYSDRMSLLGNSMKPVIRMLKDDPSSVCCHWVERHPDGLIEKEGAVENPNFVKDGKKLAAGKFKCRIACHPEWNSIDPKTVNGKTYICTCSDDPRAVNCQGCKATPGYAAMMHRLGEVVKA